MKFAPYADCWSYKKVLHPTIAMLYRVLKVIQKIKGKKTVPAAPSEESVHVSQQFSEYHHTHCVQTIEKVPG